MVWPLSALPLKYHLMFYFWPPTPVMEFSKALLLDNTIPTLRAHLCLLGGTALIFGFGVAVFWRMHDKIADALATGSNLLVGPDLGCLLHLAGRMERQNQPMKVRHVAEVLADMSDKPALGEP